jgi:hypothetical protein
MFGLVYSLIAWILYHTIAKPAQQLYNSARAAVRHSRVTSWKQAQGTITGAGTTLLGGRRQQFTPYGPITYNIPKHWKVGVSYYYTVDGEYYASADQVIVHNPDLAQELVDRYHKDGKVQLAADPAHPDKAFMVELLSN